jgi:monofunctional biosynthetic peptidoglycan transglycosylase
VDTPPFSRQRGRRWLIPALPVALLLGSAALLWLTLPDVTPLKSRNPARTALMEQRLREARREGRDVVIRQSWVPLSAIPPLLRRAVLASEDAGFYGHEGIDLEELRESLKRDWREKRLARGGSTITQQLAKNLYLSTSKNPLRKLREMLIARRLEATLSKDRILALYLNVIEFGPGIFGVEAAARHFFGKPAAELSSGESLRLVAVIPRPLAVSPRSDGAWLRWRARWILGLLRSRGDIPVEMYNELVADFAPRRRH